MNALPLPPFDEAIARTKFWMTPMLNAEEREKVLIAFDEFSRTDGPDLYQALSEHAQAKYPDSWLIDLWRKRYLLNHDSLPLTGNMAIQIDWRTPQTGLKRVAHFAIAIAHLHRLSVRDELPELRDKAGNPMCMSQWRVLDGATRKPGMPKDDYRFAEKNPQSGHIIVLYRGYAWKLRLMDEKSQVASPAQLENVLYNLIQPISSNHDVPFSTPSVLNTELAMEVRTQLLSRDENSRIMREVETAWFIASLDDKHYNDNEEAMYEATFGDGSHFWAFKPLNYIFHLRDDRIFVHLEPSHLDGGSIKDMLTLAKQLQEAGEFPRKNQLPATLDVKAMNWTIDGKKTHLDGDKSVTAEMDGTLKKVSDAIGDYQRQAETWMITGCDVFVTDEEQRLLGDYQSDALSQILLQYAQLRVYGEVYNTIEYLDLRHFINGRRDVFTTMTSDSLHFIAQLRAREAEVKDFDAAIVAHNKRLQTTLQGDGIWGFWLALQQISKILGREVALFSNPIIQRFTQPMITTMTFGAYDILSQAAFTPIDPRGLAIHYAVNRNHFNFVITHKRSKVNEVERFTRALRSGLKQILQMLKANAPEGET